MPSSPQTPSEAYIPSELPKSPFEQRFGLDGGSYKQAIPDGKGNYEPVIAPRNVKNEEGRVIGIRAEAGWTVRGKGSKGVDAMVVIEGPDKKSVKVLPRKQLDAFMEEALQGQHGDIAGLALLEGHEKVLPPLTKEFVEDAGNKAVAASVVLPSLTTEVRKPVPAPELPNLANNESPSLNGLHEKEQAPNKDFSRKKFAEILGDNNKGGGRLGESLRELGATPDEIMAALQRPGERQTAIFQILEQRARQLYDQKDDTGDGLVFKRGVDENRTKDIPAESSRYGSVLGTTRQGETQIPSLEYVAVLAYDMLSGKFDLAKDKIYTRDAKDGHHRDAAEKVLADFAKEQVLEQEHINAENPEVKKVLDTVKGELRNAQTALENNVLMSLRRLPDAFYGNGMVDVDRLYGLTVQIEHMRGQIQSAIMSMERRLDNARQDVVGAEPSDQEKLQSVKNDITQVRRQLETAGFNTTDHFWQRLYNAARTGEADSGILNMFFHQITRHNRHEDMAREIQAAVNILRKYTGGQQ